MRRKWKKWVSPLAIHYFINLFFLFSLPLSTSTVADSYRLINNTQGNKTVLEEGYYYLNNFNNILSSFGNNPFFLFVKILSLYIIYICCVFMCVMFSRILKTFTHFLFISSDSVWTDRGQQLVHHYGEIICGSKSVATRQPEHRSSGVWLLFALSQEGVTSMTSHWSRLYFMTFYIVTMVSRNANRGTKQNAEVLHIWDKLKPFFFLFQCFYPALRSLCSLTLMLSSA